MKGTTMSDHKMSVHKISGLILVILSVSFFSGNAQAAEKIQGYFNSAAREVKATADPVQKREILNNEFQSVSNALNVIESMPQTSASDRAGLERYQSAIKDNQNELNGTNGYASVPDGQLNAFSNYVVQNMEQADETITISVVTLLLIIIVVILIAR